MNSPLYPIIILAGGLATRMHPVTRTLPKALLEVGGEPFVFHQLRRLADQGFRDVILAVGYLGEQIQEKVRDGGQFGLSVRYVFDGPALLGTAGAIRNALSCLGESFFVMYGDSWLSCDFQKVQSAYVTSGCHALMTVFKNRNQWDRSNIIFDGKKILVYDKKNTTSNMEYIDYGLGVLSQRAFFLPETQNMSDLADLYGFLLKQEMLAGYEVSERFYEIGSFSGRDELNRHFQGIAEAQS